MDLIIKPLAPDLNAAYLDFFDNRAFSDDNPMGPCYCNAQVMETEELDRMVGEFGDDCKGTLRRYAVRQLDEERIFGYMAFDGEVPVGWCNAGDMRRYPVNRHQAVPDFARGAALGDTFSVVCFCVAPEYRGKGAASMLLERLVSDAAAQGFAAAEGYVNEKYAGEYWDHTGPAGLYERLGFTEAARQGELIVMRKTLK